MEANLISELKLKNGQQYTIADRDARTQIQELQSLVNANGSDSIIQIAYKGTSFPATANVGEYYWDNNTKKLYQYTDQLQPWQQRMNVQDKFYKHGDKIYIHDGSDLVPISSVLGKEVLVGDLPLSPKQGTIYIVGENAYYYADSGKVTLITDGSIEGFIEEYFRNHITNTDSKVIYIKYYSNIAPTSSEAERGTAWHNSMTNKIHLYSERTQSYETAGKNPDPNILYVYYNDGNPVLKTYTDGAWQTISKQVYYVRHWDTTQGTAYSGEYFWNSEDCQMSMKVGGSWKTFEIPSGTLLVNASDINNPKLYVFDDDNTRLISGGGDCAFTKAWQDRIEALENADPANVKTDWSEAEDDDVVSKKAIEDHYDSTFEDIGEDISELNGRTNNLGNNINQLDNRLNQIEDTIENIDPDFEKNYIPYDYLNGNNGSVNLPLNLGDNSEIGSINLQQVTSEQVRKACVIEEIKSDDNDIYNLIPKNKVITFSHTGNTQPLATNVDDGDYWLSMSNTTTYVIKKATKETISSTTVTWEVVTDLYNKEVDNNNKYYHYIDGQKIELVGNVIELVVANTSDSIGSDSGTILKNLFNTIGQEIDSETDIDRQNRDKRTITLKLYDKFLFKDCTTAPASSGPKMFITHFRLPCNVRIEGIGSNAGIYHRERLFYTEYSLEIINISFYKYAGISGGANYFTTLINVEDKVIDHLIVRNCTFDSAEGYSTFRLFNLYGRDRTPFVITTPNVNENDPATLAPGGTDGGGGNGYAGVTYSQDFTKLRKTNCINHILVENNTVYKSRDFFTCDYFFNSGDFGGSPVTTLQSCRFLDNTFFECKGIQISLGSCNMLHSLEPQNRDRTYKEGGTINNSTSYSFARYRAQVSCPAYVVGNIFDGEDKVIAVDGSSGNGAYRCPVSGDKGTIYILNNTIKNFISTATYSNTTTNGTTTYVENWYAAYDAYTRGSRIYFVNNNLTNFVCFTFDTCTSGTFKSKGNANVEAFSKIPNNMIKCYKYNTYTVDANHIKTIWDTLTENANQLAYARNFLGDNSLTWANLYDKYLNFSLDTFVDVASTSKAPDCINEVNFSHNIVKYPHIKGVKSVTGEFPVKRVVFSYNEFYGDFPDSKNWKWTKWISDNNTYYRVSNVVQNHSNQNYCYQPNNWWLFTVLNASDIEIVGNKFLNAKNSILPIVLRKYWADYGNSPKRIIVKNNDVDKSSLIYVGRIKEGPNSPSTAGYSASALL